MCESCSPNLNRREFVVGGSLAASVLSASLLRAAEGTEDEPGGATTRKKTPAEVKVVFLYPLPEVADQGKAEASWQEHRWHPTPLTEIRVVLF